MVGVTDAGRIENVRDGSTVGITGTQPGVIFASDRPKSAGYPRLFLIYCIR